MHACMNPRGYQLLDLLIHGETRARCIDVHATMVSLEPATSLVVLLLLYSAAAAAAARGCQTSCGGVSLPYPFGIGADKACYLPGFNLTCDRSSGRPILLVRGGRMQVLNISVADSTLRVMDIARAARFKVSKSATGGNGTWGGLSDAGPFVLSEKRNELVVTGCNMQVMLVENHSRGNAIAGCSSFCSVDKTFNYTYNKACTGVGCCRASIPIGRSSYGLEFQRHDTQNMHKLANTAFIAELGWLDTNFNLLLNASSKEPLMLMEVPMVLDWVVEFAPSVLPGVAVSGCPEDPARSACRSSHSSCRNVTTGNYHIGYVCRCHDGYQGNPYLGGGCQCALRHGCVKSSLGSIVAIGVGSGAGLLLLMLGAALMTRKLKQRRAKFLRQKFFKRNRGHLLEQLVSQKADIAERMIFPLGELEKATNNFDKTREIGGGGHGTVYKGILSDLHVVAIKKSKITVQREIDEFINEVAVLSQINHRNIVKLFGCCLETEVPLLAYEFISNGTLYHHLHVEEQLTSLPWEDRLRIATETATALAYLHSAVAFPIIHRDIKSQNILLDDALVAKVSDFGASRSIMVDEATIVTAVQGTIGYMDPMYYCTGRLTKKSDVYSFGVLLMELLTRKKPYSYRSSEDNSLVMCFTRLLKESNLIHVLDPQVVKEGGKEVKEVAVLAAACVRMEGEDRPTMKQVEIVLEGLRAPPPETSMMLSKIDTTKYTIIQRRSSEKEEASRQYSLEQEYLLSSRYPR